MKQKLLFAVFLSFVMIVSTTHVQANTIGRGFSPIDFRALTQTYFSMYKGGNPGDDMLDEYAKMAYCDLYQKYFTNDFEWEKIRNHIKGDLEKYASNIQTDYEIVGDVSLDRYNFDRKGFPVVGEGHHENVGKLYLFSSGTIFSFCGQSKESPILPASYTVSLFNPFSVDILRVSPEVAKDVVARFYQDKKKQYKRVFARYRVKLYDLNRTYQQDGLVAEFQGEILSIDYFIDPELTQKFHTIDFHALSEE